MLSFIAGVALSALIAFWVARSVVKSRIAETERSVRLQAESSLKVELARLESDLEHTRRQLQSTRDENAIALQSAKYEAAKSLEDTKAEMGKRYAEDLAARKSADELAAAFKHGSKLQGDWGETILEELLSSQGLTRGVHFDTQPVIRGTDGKPVKNEDGARSSSTPRCR